MNGRATVEESTGFGTAPCIGDPRRHKTCNDQLSICMIITDYRAISPVANEAQHVTVSRNALIDGKGYESYG